MGLFSASGLLQPVSLTAHSFGNISILSQILKILGPDAVDGIHYRWNWCAWVSDEVVNNRI